MNLSAIGHSATSFDCYPLSKGRFQIRLRSARGDLRSVTLHYQDKYLPLSVEDTRKTYQMEKDCSDEVHDHWIAELNFDVVCLRYWFELTDFEGKTVFFSNNIFSNEPFSDTDDMFDCPQNLREEACFITPRWAENKVIYQVFPSRFASSRPVEDSVWYKTPITAQDDLHGDLRGVISHLDHLQRLGIDVLYMTPIFYSHSCHKYDTIDYYRIDPSFGTKEDLKDLVTKAHELGIRVILDGVFNHTSPEFFAFADIREKEAASPYLDWYFIQSFPLRAEYGEKPSFKTFSYFGGMPKLNVKNPEVTKYILEVVLYWLRECKVDGWRLDVGDEIGHPFWKTFRSAVKKEFPEALIIGEVWHYAPDFLQGDEWDTVMNYPFYQATRDLLLEKISAETYMHRLGFLQGHYHPKVYPLLWNLIDSHDTPRMRHLCGKEKLRLAAALQLLQPGMPMIYYGDEVGMEGGADPDCRRGMLWDEARQDRELFAWYRRLISARKNYPILLDRSTKSEAVGQLLIRRAEGLRIIFNCGETTSLPELSGKLDLLSGSRFDGTLAAYQTILIEE